MSWLKLACGNKFGQFSHVDRKENQIIASITRLAAEFVFK